MPRLAAAVLLALLAAGSGGCVILTPTIPTGAVGYGHTYAVVDQDGNPIKEGFLLLESAYEPGQTMYNCYDIADGRAEVPFKVAVRAGGGPYSDNVPLFWFISSNPAGTTISPLVPGYVPDGPPEGWDKRYRVVSPLPPSLANRLAGYKRDWDEWSTFAGKPPPDIHLVKADPETEAKYLRRHEWLYPNGPSAREPAFYTRQRQAGRRRRRAARARLRGGAAEGTGL